MATPDEEAELEQTKMSFGEHLEELRRALFKSLLALFVGVIVGFFVGIPLVDYIQEPLRRALLDYKFRRAVAKELAYLREQKAAGRAVPENLEAAAKQRVERGGTPHEYLVDADEFIASLAERYPDLADAARRSAASGAAETEATDAAPTSAEATRDRAAQGMIRIRLWEPLAEEDRVTTIATDSFEPMMVYLKASFAAGLVLASPFIFYYMWEFVAAGLYRSEKKYVHIYLPFSLTLFILGAALAYYFAFDYMLQFLFWLHQKMGIEPYPRLSDWITTVVLMPLGFGVSFQLPLVMLLLERIGVFSIASYLSKWRISVVIMAVLSMVLTPSGDISSMMLMFVPLVGLYFLGILLCKYMPGGPLRSPLRDRPRPPRPEESAGS
jgi:sec-independent protein translocase protein TatC